MRGNVRITIRERGKIVGRREGHNVWVDLGEKYLAEVISLSAFGPDTPERDDRLKYVGLGIGGAEQSLFTIASSPPYSTSYPAGADPNATTGNEYRDDVPTQPLVTTLERPVRVSGGSTAYPGAGSDVWLVGPPKILTLHPALTKVEIVAFVDGTAGDVVYSPFDTLGMPLSEAGLFLSSVTVPGVPFNPLVAYHTFDTINLTTAVDLEFSWTVSF